MSEHGSGGTSAKHPGIQPAEHRAVRPPESVLVQCTNAACRAEMRQLRSIKLARCHRCGNIWDWRRYRLVNLTGLGGGTS